jgi:hypothetical protein
LLRRTFALGVFLTNCLPFLLPAAFFRDVAALSALVKLSAFALGKQRVVALPGFIVPQGPVILPAVYAPSPLF